MLLKEQDVRQTVLRKSTKNSLISTSELAKICKTSQRTVQRGLKKFCNTGTTDRKSRNSRPTRSFDKIIEKKVCVIYKKHPSLLARDVAKKVGSSSSNVQKIKKRCNIKAYKKKKARKRTTEQYLMMITVSNIFGEKWSLYYVG
ncbi:hypothetical protein ILUMI_24204 [Ignelater luminosus]|uniref:Transposase n=1 Tax=Ignelater luminosus TaxID=2038154 RepID=A0A8K0CAY1_IGNLU|nr:hypothetical protein ILUMI_24204 [Ignelater luminosus]